MHHDSKATLAPVQQARQPTSAPNGMTRQMEMTEGGDPVTESTEEGAEDEVDDETTIRITTTTTMATPPNIGRRFTHTRVIMHRRLLPS